MTGVTTLIAEPPTLYRNEKTWSQERGPSVCFRNWRAGAHHCAWLHGYALGITISIASYELDERGWIVDFAGMKQLKQWIDDMFDHKTVVEHSDPSLPTFQQLHRDGIVSLVTIDQVSCEGFAREIYKLASDWLSAVLKDDRRAPRPWIESVTITEHTGNSAMFVAP